ncbi:hypothetical protein LINPERPRIM_LOCUS31675 [Linum perenne]
MTRLIMHRLVLLLNG